GDSDGLRQRAGVVVGQATIPRLAPKSPHDLLRCLAERLWPPAARDALVLTEDSQTMTRGTSEAGGLPGRSVFKTAMRPISREPSPPPFTRPRPPVRAAEGCDPGDHLVVDGRHAARYSGFELIVCACDSPRAPWSPGVRACGLAKGALIDGPVTNLLGPWRER